MSSQRLVSARSLILLVAFAGTVSAQTVLQLKHTPPGGSQQTCIYTTDAAGVSLDSATGNLVATGTFSTGCPTGGGGGSAASFTNDIATDIAATIATNALQTLTWSADADNCTYDGSTFPAGVTFANWPTSGVACSTSASCGTLHTVQVTPPSDGTYKFKLNCTRSPNATVVSSEVTTVASAASGACIAPAGLTRLMTGSVKHATGVSHSENVTMFENIFGWVSASQRKLWPGVKNLLQRPMIGRNQYIALKFTVPTGMSTNNYGKYRFEETQPETLMSMTISTECGDFRPAASNPIAPSCVQSDMYTGGSNPTAIYWKLPGSTFPTSTACPLQPGQTYYLNIVHAGIADPTASYCAGTCGNQIANEGTGVWP
jgi:hypothetical protein